MIKLADLEWHGLIPSDKHRQERKGLHVSKSEGATIVDPILSVLPKSKHDGSHGRA